MSDVLRKLRDDLDDLLTKRDRYKRALGHIADGNISPAMSFAQYVLGGSDVMEAHTRASRDE